MTNQIMITPNQIKANEPYEGFAKKAIANITTELDKPFPISLILDADDFDHFDNIEYAESLEHIDNTIDCFMLLPSLKENKHILEKFALFCAKRAAKHAGDKLMGRCIDVIEDFIKYGVGLEQLKSTIRVTDIIADDYCDLPLGFTAESVGYLARLLQADADTDTPKRINSYVTNAYYSALQAVANDDKEVEEQANYLRKLLDGEEV